MNFNINKPHEGIRKLLEDKVDNLTKPKGSLGMLENLAIQIGLIQQTLSPRLCSPHNVLFAADHGIVDEGVSKSPKEITWQQVAHFLNGVGGVNFLCKQHGFTLDVVDAGVDFDFPSGCGVIDKKIRKGTRNYLYQAAMTEDEVEQCFTGGVDVINNIFQQGCNVVSFGEMAIGNTSSSSLWMTCLTGIPLVCCVGAGSGLDKEGVRHKYDVLNKALKNYKGNGSVMDVIRYFGGYEMVMAIGAMLRAAELNMVILIDGFIMTNCILAASKLYSNVLNYAVFGHMGDESGHKLLLEYLNVKPVLNLNLRLGEGTGAICAYPIIVSAVNMINEMDSFNAAAVTKYFD